jgi:hypothetical protein
MGCATSQQINPSARAARKKEARERASSFSGSLPLRTRPPGAYEPPMPTEAQTRHNATAALRVYTARCRADDEDALLELAERRASSRQSSRGSACDTAGGRSSPTLSIARARGIVRPSSVNMFDLIESADGDDDDVAERPEAPLGDHTPLPGQTGADDGNPLDGGEEALTRVSSARSISSMRSRSSGVGLVFTSAFSTPRSSDTLPHLTAKLVTYASPQPKPPRGLQRK